jgi:aldose 1-epimerase
MQTFSVQILNNENFSTIILENKVEKTSIEVFQFGAILNAFNVPTKESFINIIDGFSNSHDAQNHITDAFKSAFLSPFTCRMKGGMYTHNNKQYTTNKFILKPHAIHGLIYDVKYSIDNVVALEEEAVAELSYIYTGNENGYPFNYTVKHSYSLQKNCSLSIHTTVTNNGIETIPYAQGWHPYFTLGEKVDNCTFQIASNKMIEFDETLIPTGNILEYSKFVEPQKLKDTQLDNCFDVQTANHNKVCTLSNNTLSLNIFNTKNYPYLQVYTPPHRNSIALENLSGTPDCFNNHIGLMLIEPNTSVNFTTLYNVQSL